MSAILRHHRARYYTVAEAADRLGLRRATVTRRCERGQYRTRPHRDGERWQIFAAEIEAELRRREEV